MSKTVSGAMWPTRILPHRHGPARQKIGGYWPQRTLTGWEDLYGLVLITGANLLLFGGPISIPILALWICVGSQRIFTITISPGGRTKMCCIFLPIGTGGIKEASRSM